jgi:two-component system sensor histidine kinase ChvG
LRSLRLRALVVALVVLALPPVFVFGWLVVERTYQSRMQANAQFSAREARELLLRVMRTPAGARAGRCGGFDLDSTEPLRDVARGHRVRLKLLNGQGQECFDHDADVRDGWSRRASSVLLGSPSSTARAGGRGAAAPPPIEVQPGDLEAARAGGSSTGCRAEAEGQGVECYALLKLDGDNYLFVADSAWRPATILNELERPILHLTLASVPFAVALAWWLSRRLVRPVEKLREQVLKKLEAANAAAESPPLRGNEVEDLAASFNQLLDALEQRRLQEASSAADLVHELKNPLAAVRACGEALQNPALEPEQRARLGKVLEQSGSRLLRLATEYLETARAEAQLPGESREPVDLGELVSGVCSSFENDARHAAVEIAARVVPAKVLGVPHRLESVVRNLLENALHACGAHGKVEVDVSAAEGRVMLAVADSGPGIRDDELPRLFERFYSKRGDGAGTGLGLALCRAIVEAHGGTLRAANGRAGGARFEAELPSA